MATTTIPVSANGADAAAHAAQMRDMAAALHQRAEANKIVNTMYRGFARVKHFLRSTAAAVRTSPFVARVLAAASTAGKVAAGLFALAGPANVARALAFTRTGRKVVVGAASAAWSALRAGGRVVTGLLGACGSPGRRAAGFLNGASGVATAAVQAVGSTVLDKARSLVARSVRDGRLTKTGWAVLTITVLLAGAHLYTVVLGAGAVAAIATNVAVAYLPGWAPVVTTAIGALKSLGLVFALNTAISDFFGLMSTVVGADLKVAEFDAEAVPMSLAAATVGYGFVVGMMQNIARFATAYKGSRTVLLATATVAPAWVAAARIALVVGGGALFVFSSRRTYLESMVGAKVEDPEFVVDTEASETVVDTEIVVDPAPDAPAA